MARLKGNTMATPTPTDNTVKKSVIVFDPATLTPVKKEFTFTHVDSPSIEHAQERLNSYGETGQKRLLTVLNNTLAFFSAREARNEAVGNALSKKAVFAVVKAFRSTPMFAGLNPGDGTKEGYKKQGDAILEMMRATPGMAAMISSANAGGDDEGDDDSDDTGE